jgi:hypothetical protein
MNGFAPFFRSGIVHNCLFFFAWLNESSLKRTPVLELFCGTWLRRFCALLLQQPFRQSHCVGGVDSEEDPLGYCFLRAIGGIAFTIQRDKIYNTLGINSLYLF